MHSSVNCFVYITLCCETELLYSWWFQCSCYQQGCSFNIHSTASVNPSQHMFRHKLLFLHFPLFCNFDNCLKDICSLTHFVNEYTVSGDCLFWRVCCWQIQNGSPSHAVQLRCPLIWCWGFLTEQPQTDEHSYLTQSTLKIRD